MFRPRVIPCLTLSGNGLVKTRKFKNPVYIGDPVNAVRIFNDKYTDELIILDIDASRKSTPINFPLVKNIAEEAFMPLAYGGGIKTIDDVNRLFEIGIEKVIINSAFAGSSLLVENAVRIYGNQSITISIDIKKNIWGAYNVFIRSGTKKISQSPSDYINRAVSAGAGEIFLNSIDRDGEMTGYDIPLIKSISEGIKIPLIACGGAGNITHIRQVFTEGKASAASAGSFFVFNGPHKAVLISYPGDEEIKSLKDIIDE
jgi:imidazole glycerol-phosphate synthase subunit HisF